MALVFAQLGDRRARLGLAGLLEPAPGGARASCGAIVAQGPPRVDGADGGRPRRGVAAPTLCVAMRGGLEAFLASGPRDPRVHAAAAALAGDRWRAAGGADRRAAVHAAFAAGAALFPDPGRQAAQGALRNTRRPSSRRERGLAAPQDLVTGHAAALVARPHGLSPRPQRAGRRAACGGCIAIAEREYRATLDAHAVLDFRRPAATTRCGCSARWRSSRRAATGWSRAITTCSWTSSRTPAGRSGSWCRCSCESWGEGAGLAYQGPLEPSVFIVGDRKQSIYGFRDADVVGAGRCRPAICPAAARRRRAALDLAQLPLGAAAAGVRERRLRRHRQGAGPGRRVRLRRATTASRSTTRRPSRRRTPALGWSPATTPRRAPRQRLPRSPRLVAAARSCATARPACRGRSGRRRRHPVSHAREPPRVRGRAGARGPAVVRLQGPRVLRRRRDQGRAGAALVSGGAGVRTCAPRRCFARGSCGCRTRGCGAWPRRWPRRWPQDDPGAARGCSTTTDAARLAAARVVVGALAGARRIALPPAELFDLVLRESAYGVELRGPRFAAGAREPEEAAGADAPHPEPRLRDAWPRLRAHLDRLAVGDESNAAHRRHRRREPDDRSTRPRVSSFRWSSSSTCPAGPATAASPSASATEQAATDGVGVGRRLPVGGRRGSRRRGSARRPSVCSTSR